jgi:type II restriction/modification system DNA methylase subunit YeeA
VDRGRCGRSRCHRGIGADLNEQQYLNGNAVSELNPDLESGAKLISATRLPENKAVAFEGTKKYGDFESSGELARGWLLEPKNVNGRSNAEVLRPWLNGRDFSSRSSGRWIIDFSGLSETESSYFESPYQHALKVVKPTRQLDRNAKTRSIWWRFERERMQLRVKLKGTSRFIATTRHSKFRLFAWTNSCVIPDSALIAIARDDDTTFGILHSRFHGAWSLRLGTWLGVGNDPRYTPSTTFERFPFRKG